MCAHDLSVAGTSGFWRRCTGMKRADQNTAYTPDPAERVLVEELDREVSRKGGLFALLACLAIVAGLALSIVLALAATPV